MGDFTVLSDGCLESQGTAYPGEPGTAGTMLKNDRNESRREGDERTNEGGEEQGRDSGRDGE